jgi:hypothetical protein
MKNINLVKQQIEKIRTLMRSSLDQIDKETIQRHRKLETAHILYCLCLKVCYHTGYQDSISKIEGEGFSDNITYQSINNKVLSGKYTKPFENLNQYLIQNLFPTKNTTIRTAVDGSRIRLPISLERKGYLRRTTDPYTTGLISTIYDLENHIPICYSLEKNLNERKVFLGQFSKTDQSMIVIGDRGYYSEDVMFKILETKRDFIFRLPINSRFIKQSKGKETITNVGGFTIRIIPYQLSPKKYCIVKIKRSPGIKMVHNKDYYLVTSLVDSSNYPTDQVIDCYHRRWEIEEYYKTIKNRLVTGTVLSTTETGILNEIAVQQMLSIFTRFFSNLLTTNVHQKMNHIILMKRIVDYILPSIFFDKPYTGFFKDLIGILENLEKYRVPIRNGRSFPREQRFHRNKFPTKKFKPIDN